MQERAQPPKAEAVVVVAASLEPGFMGEPPVLQAPLGGSTLLRATLERLVGAGLGAVSLCYPDLAVNRALAQVVEGLDVRLVPSRPGATEPEMARAIVAEGSVAVLVDARAAWVSPTILREQIALQARSGAEVCLAPLAAAGLAGIVATRPALERLGRAVAMERRHDPTADACSVCSKVRSTFEVSDLTVEDRFICVPAALVPRSPADVAALAELKLEGQSEEYGPIFDAICAREWTRWARFGAPRRPLRAARPKVLFAHYTASRDPGSTTALETLLDHWDRERFEIGLVLPCFGPLYDHLEGRVPVSVLPIRWFASYPGTAPGSLWTDEVAATLGLLEEEQPDLLYVSGTLPTMAYAARLFGIPCISHIHVPILTTSAPVAAELAPRSALPMYDAVISPGLMSAQRAKMAFRPPPGRLSGVPCGIPERRFVAGGTDGAAIRAEFGIGPTQPVVTVAGISSPVKRPELAVEALPTLLERLPDAVLCFAGGERLDGSYRQRLLARAAALGVLDHVRFYGHRSDMPAVYAATDVLLHCAIGDQFPQVLGEAMMMERPVVAIADLGSIEIVTDGKTGRLVKAPGDPKELGTVLAEVLSDRARLAEMGRAARLDAQDRLTATMYARRIEDVCHRLLSGTHARAGA